jgi:hypothetical protein
MFMNLMFAAAISAATIAPAPTAANDASPAAIVQRQIDAYNGGNVERFVDLYAEDAELFDFGPAAAPIMRGREALSAHNASLFAKYQPQVAILARITDGDFVIDRERVTGKGKSKDGVAIYQVTARKIRRVWFTP